MNLNQGFIQHPRRIAQAPALGAHGLDVGGRRAAMDTGLATPERVQIGAIQYQDRWHCAELGMLTPGF
jgi:hypothetical protein